jgi:hypothetical protein
VWRAAQAMRMQTAAVWTVWYAEAAVWLPEETIVPILLIKDNMYNVYIISFELFMKIPLYEYDETCDESSLLLSSQQLYISTV